MRMKAVLCGGFLALMAFITPAFAAERIEPAFFASSDPAKIAAEVLYDGNASVSSYGTSKSEKSQVLNAVQSYVDAVSASSTTPTVKGSVVNSGKSNEQMKLVLISGENEFTKTELQGFSARAGKSAQSIGAYLCQTLSYDDAAASKKLSLSSPQATAKGSLSSGKAICQGYAISFAVLSEQA